MALSTGWKSEWHAGAIPWQVKGGALAGWSHEFVGEQKA